MTKKLKKAWKKTSKKWEHIIENNGINLDTLNCGLCSYDDDMNGDCGNCSYCPISKLVNKTRCRRTPYYKWEKNPTIKNAELEYMFLLFVYEATK